MVVDGELAGTRLHWLSAGATQASPDAIKAEVGKLQPLPQLTRQVSDTTTNLDAARPRVDDLTADAAFARQPDPAGWPAQVRGT